MTDSVVTVSRLACRRFLRRALFLDQPADLETVFRGLGFVQIDPINVCGRIHDLILRPRVRNYREEQFLTRLHRPAGRLGFEHYLPDTGVLAAFPFAAYPFLKPAMDKRRRARGYHGALTAEEARLAKIVITRLREEGPLESSDFDHAGRVLTAWGTSGRLVKTVLDKLFAHGEILISRRRHFRRVYDLPERIIPPEWLAAPIPTAAEVERWLLLLRFRQRRLLRLKTAETKRAAAFARPVSVEDRFQVWCLHDDVDALRAAESARGTRVASQLLAPLDPVIYDRRLTRLLWDFEYTWEVYTPPAKRLRGYYALPLLAGTRFAGHIEPRADRKTGRLTVVSAELTGRVNPEQPLRRLARCLRLAEVAMNGAG